MSGTRYIHAELPDIFLPNGFKVGLHDLPSAASMRYFINKLLGAILVEANPIAKHCCNKFCRHPSRLMLGFPNSSDVKSSCPVDIRNMVVDFENLLNAFYADDEESLEIHTIMIDFMPCPKVVEIIKAAFYL